VAPFLSAPLRAMNEFSIRPNPNLDPLRSDSDVPGIFFCETLKPQRIRLPKDFSPLFLIVGWSSSNKVHSFPVFLVHQSTMGQVSEAPPWFFFLIWKQAAPDADPRAPSSVSA